MRDFTISLALAGVLLLAPAQAHDSWISRGGLRAPAAAPNAGEWCCGVGDCALLDQDAVKATQRGYQVDGFGTIGEGAGAIRVEIHELVPVLEAQPSPDGRYWRCQRPDKSRRCFFAPPPNS